MVMTIKELIDQLSKFHPKATVWCALEDGRGHHIAKIKPNWNCMYSGYLDSVTLIPYNIDGLPVS